jgi:hypothetical protein
MNVEVITQVCDTVAFILVTPEIAGEERIVRIRHSIKRVKCILIDLDYSWKSITSVTVTLLAFCLVTFGLAFLVARFYFCSANELAAFALNLVALFILANADHILGTLDSAIVRGRLLGFGFMLFFASRMISIWMAIHHP